MALEDIDFEITPEPSQQERAAIEAVVSKLLHQEAKAETAELDMSKRSPYGAPQLRHLER